MALYPCVLGRLRNGDFSRCKWRTSCRVCLLLWDANVPWYLVAITCASKQISCALCRRRDTCSPYTWYICVLGDHRMSIFFLPGVAVLRFRVYSLLWHACVLLKHSSLFRSTSHLQNLSSVQQVVCVSCPLCLCICIYSCKSVLYITYGRVRGRPEMDGKLLAHSGFRRL